MVREDVLGRFPNRGLLRRGHSVQIILGPEAVEVSEAVRRRLDGLQKD
jgi:phosphotransferase system IIB component